MSNPPDYMTWTVHQRDLLELGPLKVSGWVWVLYLVKSSSAPPDQPTAELARGYSWNKGVAQRAAQRRLESLSET